jgi:thiol-disulfide isomerase/thioredoxin
VKSFLRLSLAACVLSACAPSLPASEPHALLAKTPPKTEQVDLQGEMVAFPPQGKVTLIDFWSTSCKPCLKIIPGVQALNQEHKAEGLAVFGVAIDDNPSQVERQLKSLGVSYPNVLDDAASSIRGAYQVDELPQTFVLDRKGTVRFVAKGGDAADEAAIRSAVEFLLAESN